MSSQIKVFLSRKSRYRQGCIKRSNGRSQLMTLILDDTTEDFLALVNRQGQYSLWPHSLSIPTGWESVFGPSQRNACVDYIECHWLDLHPVDRVI
ncbi:MbtH family protein [Pseudomonas syringae]|uniref:MbtH family protein n=2 Tax=Pseudomonas syringae group TaxID=136849 RepID=UPI00287B7C9A|nr:MbtH family protein [Pseudomonas syringae]